MDVNFDKNFSLTRIFQTYFKKFEFYQKVERSYFKDLFYSLRISQFFKISQAKFPFRFFLKNFEVPNLA